MSNTTKVLKGELTISEMMSRELVTVPLGTPLGKVATLLTEGYSRHVLVTDVSGAIVGVVSDRDVLRHVLPDQTDAMWENKTVESVMMTKFVAGSPDANPNDVASVLLDGSIQCLPILEGGRLVGVMTPGDLLMSCNRLRPVLQQAGVDHLTGLASRATFDRRLEEELERSRRQRIALALILCDVDHFRQINEACGHSTGDAMLRLVADSLGRHFRSYDVLARFGGDEFAVICSGCGPEDIESPIERLQRAIRSMSVPLNGVRRGITLSIGAALTRPDFEPVSPAQLIHAAEACLNRAKQDGRDGFRLLEMRNAVGQRPNEHPMDTGALLDSLLRGIEPVLQASR